MSGSSGNLAAVELRRTDRGDRGVNGERINADERDEEITDYTGHGISPAVTLDGPVPVLTPSQREAAAQADATRYVPSRRRVRTTRRRVVSPTDDRSELQVLRSTVEGLAEKMARLEAGVQFLLNERHPNGIPFDGSRTS